MPPKKPLPRPKRPVRPSVKPLPKPVKKKPCSCHKKKKKH